MSRLRRVFGVLAISAATPPLAWTIYSRKCHWIPYDATSKSGSGDLVAPVFRRLNPYANKPICMDHCVREVPLSSLPSQDVGELTTKFAQGVWGGWGFEVQRRLLQKWYRGWEGREKHLWDKDDLRTSGYKKGTMVADHFEVVERTPSKVAIRCGDSPTKQGPRNSDGTFTFEVTKDEQKGTATFHLRSIFFDSSVEGKDHPGLSERFLWGHRQYTMLLMESGVRSMIR